MKKLLIALVATGLAILAIAAPVLGAGDDLPETGRIVFVTGGEIEIGADEQADAVVILGGTGAINGTVNTLVLVDGTAVVAGATLESIVAVRGELMLSPDTTVLGDISHLDAVVLGAEQATIGGSIRDLLGDVAGWGIFLGAAAILFWIGVGVATLLFGLLLAGVAARQVRAATTLIRREPVTVGLVGLLSIVLAPVLAILAMVTIVGIPTGIGILLVVWPTVAFIGYVVAAIWLGEWLTERGRAADEPRADRPYGAAVLGLIVAFVLGFIPIATAVLSILGIGAVLLGGWRTLRGTGTPASVLQPSPA